MSTSSQKNSSRPISRNEAKWGQILWNADGWTGLPNIIFRKAHRLLLDAVDIVIILHIASYWWEPDNKPFPSKKKIAVAMGINESTVRRHIAAMEYAKLIRREPRRTKKDGQTGNIYHLDGLIKAATPYAYEEMQSIAAERAARAARAKRKGPAKLHVVK